jgi:hypothetical protein
MVRGKRSRMLMYVDVVVVVGMEVYVLNGEKLKIDDESKVEEKCKKKKE